MNHLLISVNIAKNMMKHSWLKSYLMPPSHLELAGIKQNQPESKFELDSGGNFKSARMPLDYFEPTWNDSCIFLCISSRMQLECSWNTVGILRILLECSKKI